ncbi:MAG: signal peptidase II [Desulfovibrio sp.]|nr:signal peptidase II [Desulfovibrio sp.]
MRRFVTVGAPATALFALDQAGKYLASDFVGYGEAIRVTGFFNLVHARNYGAAFGFLDDPSLGIQVWLFGGATLAALVAVFLLARSAEGKDGIFLFALGLIAGGALGNLADRVRLGAVVDFLDFHYGALHWPAFNFADMGICIGAGFAALSMVRGKREEAG